jgi:hypothetical protein
LGAQIEEGPEQSDLLVLSLAFALVVMVVLGLVLGDVFEIFHNGSSL